VINAATAVGAFVLCAAPDVVRAFSGRLELEPHYHDLDPKDAQALAAMRASMNAQKGKYMGVDARPAFEKQKLGVQAAADVRTEVGEVGGVLGWWCRPSNPRTDAALIYHHGGWYMLGTAKAFCNQVSHFAALTRSNTFIPDYRLAPEARFPAAYDDAVAAYRGLATSGLRKIVLAGDSVGGALSLLVLVAAAADPSLATKPLGAVAMSPTTDLTLSGESMRSRAEADPIFTRDMVAQFVDAYLAGNDASDPRASPLFADLRKLAPVRIDVGEDEILLDDAVRFAERAAAAGVKVSLDVWAGMPHTFQAMIGKLDAASKAVQAETAFLNRLLDEDI
jgi:acetyl esterase/lipase